MLEIIKVSVSALGGIVEEICDVGWVCGPIEYPCSPTLTCAPVVIHLQPKCIPAENDDL